MGMLGIEPQSLKKQSRLLTAEPPLKCLSAPTFFIDLSQMFKELHSWLTVKQEVERVLSGSVSDSCGFQRFLDQLMTQSQQCSGDYSTTKSLRNVHLTTLFYSQRNGDSVQLIQFLTLTAYEHYL